MSSAPEGQQMAAIFDMGSHMTQVGMQNHTHPSAEFHTKVGVPRRGHRSKCDRDFYCGSEVKDKLDDVTVYTPIESGIIENFQHIEMLYDYAFIDVLNIEADSHPVLIAQPSSNPKPNKERTVELLFEAFGVPSLSMNYQGFLSLMAYGRMTGLIVECGHGLTACTPCYEGFTFPHLGNNVQFGGELLDIYLSKLISRTLTKRGEKANLTSNRAKRSLQGLKEKSCFVTLEPNLDNQVKHPVEHILPDGTKIELTDELWKTPEALFYPNSCGIEGHGIADLAHATIQSVPVDIRPHLMQSIVLCGGTTLLPNFSERFLLEMTQACPINSTCRVLETTDDFDQRHSVWRGGQVYCQLREFQPESWMTSAEYDEYGAEYIHEKGQKRTSR